MQPSWKIGVEQLVLPASLSYFHRNWPSLADTLIISLLMIWTYCFTPPASATMTEEYAESPAPGTSAFQTTSPVFLSSAARAACGPPGVQTTRSPSTNGDSE